MKEKSKVEQLINQIGDMVKMIQDHKGPIADNITPEVLNKLEWLETIMSQYQELNQKTFQEAGIDIEKLRHETLGSETISPKNAQVLKRTQEIEKEAKKLQREYERIIAQNNLQPQAAKTKDPLRQNIKDRRKRYKPLGGDKNWIPI
jgi:hypothetical protein